MTEPQPPTFGQKLMTPAEVAKLFRVDPKTVGRWAARAGRLPYVLTPGRQKRYREDDVRAALKVWFSGATP